MLTRFRGFPADLSVGSERHVALLEPLGAR